MTGEMLKPLEGRPYLDQWKERMTEPAKPVKVKKKHHKKGRKKVKR